MHLSCFKKLIYPLTLIIITLFLSSCSLLEQVTSASIEDESTVIHQLIDTLYEDEDFRLFHSSIENMNIISQFYNALNTHDDLLFLGLSDQYLFAEDIKVIEDASEKSENLGQYWMIPSLQLNKNAFNYFNLTVQEGTSFEWNDINLSNDVQPAIMGSNYADLYQLKDEIEVLFFIRPITLKIIGFLDSNQSSLSYNGEPFYDIDSYIILPLPEYIQPFDELDEEELFHYAITSFAMINGYIVKPKRIEDIERTLDAIGNEVGFQRFDLVTVPIDDL